MDFIIIAVAQVLLFLMMAIWAKARYKRCPPDRILVVYGRVEGGASSKCIHGGAAFVFPVVQDYAYLDLTPIAGKLFLEKLRDKNGNEAEMEIKYIVQISTEPGIMENAADRLLSVDRNGVNVLSMNIFENKIREVIATTSVGIANEDWSAFMEKVVTTVGRELSKVGLNLNNMSIPHLKENTSKDKPSAMV